MREELDDDDDDGEVLAWGRGKTRAFCSLEANSLKTEQNLK